MNKGTPRVAIYPASFDPITLGHLDVAIRAAQLFDRLILAVYDRPLKTLLFPTAARVGLTREAVRDLPNVRVATYSGLTVQYAREVGAKAIVRGLRTVGDFEREWSMAQLNRGMEPEIEVVLLMSSHQYSYVSSSSVKEIAALGGPIDHLVPPHVAKALEQEYASRRAS